MEEIKYSYNIIFFKDLKDLLNRVIIIELVLKPKSLIFRKVNMLML